MLETENGPHCDDEINRIRKGGNYGWRLRLSMWDALHRWTPTIAPTDPVWYEGPLWRLSGSLYVGDFVREKLRRFNFDSKVKRVRSSWPIVQSSRLISEVSKGPGGCLYWATCAFRKGEATAAELRPNGAGETTVRTARPGSREERPVVAGQVRSWCSIQSTKLLTSPEPTSAM
ncbi:MAG: PQQ-dependent sugar dehydrogenase [Actinomycetota bacterium]